MTQMEILSAAIRAAPVLLARLAIAHTRTVEGVHRIWRVEKDGLCRPEVLRAAERRIEELGGTQLERTTPLIEVTGQAIETESLTHELGKKIIVAGTGIYSRSSGIGRRHF